MYAGMRADHGPVVPVELEPGVRGWLVTDYSTLISWSRDTTAFSHDPRLWRDLAEGRVRPDSPLLPAMAPRSNARFVDGTEHQRYRGAITDVLGGVGAEHLGRITAGHADRLVDGFCGRGAADVLDEYARPLPLLVLNDLFGFDGEQGLRFATAMRDLRLGADAEGAGAEAVRVLSEAVSDKHRAPGDDLTSGLIRHRAGLSDEEVAMQLLLVAAAAGEPTSDLIGAAVRAVLADPAVSGDDAVSLSDAALGDLVDRVLWADPPITAHPAVYPRVDIPLDGGRVIEAGSPVLLGFAAANHFFLRENAELMEETPNRAHLAWGAGPHRCPARDEAASIAIIATRTLLTRLPGLRAAVPAEDLRWRLAGPSWTPVELPVLFTPQQPSAPAPVEGDPGGPSHPPPETSAHERPASGGSPLSSLSSFLERLRRGS
ncbi:cytochrome P450 [Nocardiopsis sp. NPDC101807]|uniref:cytochrome P450 n=1 Tax=Nocardiopsis sp. NPDC101807 TaxID=3364339 RepID=UPI0037FD1E1F